MTGSLQRPRNGDDLDGDMNTSRHQPHDSNKSDVNGGSVRCSDDGGLSVLPYYLDRIESGKFQWRRWCSGNVY
jgi:hypothetical protein